MNDGLEPKPGQGAADILLQRHIPWTRILTTAGVFLAVMIFVALFYKSSPAGLIDRRSMDIAQVARNISEGKGFTTRMVRPFNVVLNKSEDIGLPEMNHAPAYPYAVALLFKVKNPCDQIVVWTSLGFLLLAVIATYLLGSLLFDWRVGLLAASVFATSLPVLKIALSGQEWTFAALCFTLLLYVIGLHHKSAQNTNKLPGIILTIAAAVLLAVLYMTNRVMIFLAVPTAMYFAITGPRQRLHLIAFLAAFIVLIGFGIYKNIEYTESPILGINAWDIMADSTAFPGDTLYRSTDSKNLGFARTLLFPMEHFSAFGEKLMRRTNDMISTLIPLIGLLALPFAVVSIMYKFKIPTANAIRGLLYGMLPLVIVCFAIFSVDTGSMIMFAPVAAIFASGYFLLLLNAKKLHPVYTKFLIGGFMFVTCFGALTNILWSDASPKPYAINIQDQFFNNLGSRGFSQLLYTDAPWVAAWRTDGTAVWLPLKDEDIVELDVNGLPMQGIILTPESDNFSPTEIWYTLHKVRLWREYIANPTEGTKKFLSAAGITSDKSPEAQKFLQRLGRSFAVSESLADFAPQQSNPLDPDDIQILVKK